MMKILLNILFLMVVQQGVFSQVPDTIPIRKDSVPPVHTDSVPVLSDTTHYNDSAVVINQATKDTSVKKKQHSPRKATIRSLIIPGWGQVYNKKYWKVPIVYGAIGVPVYLFKYNKTWFNRTKYALSIVAFNRTDPDSLSRVHPELKALVEHKLQGSLVNYRNEFRKNMDLSILIAILMWGLNIVDATVDGHLKDFDVSDDLSLKIKPSIMPGSMAAGISLVVNFK